ncbi:hypothetical protein AFLA70_8g006560, partial [Aspergillus flavus AF70]
MIDLNVRRIKPAVERHWFQRQGTAVSLSVDRLAPSFNLSTIYLLAGFAPLWPSQVVSIVLCPSPSMRRTITLRDQR